MKIREGHVSNSSSSSFFIVATKKAYDEAKKKVSKLSAQTAEAVEKVFKIGGQDLVIVNITYGESDDGQLDGVIKGYIEEHGKQKLRNCSHKLPQENMKYCPECGREAWSKGQDDYEIRGIVQEAFARFTNALEEDKKNAIVDHDFH